MTDSDAYDRFCETLHGKQCPRCGEMHTDAGQLCEQCREDLVELGEIEEDEEWPVDPNAAVGPNGCRCGFNGDCNCPFVEFA